MTAPTAVNVPEMIDDDPFASASDPVVAPPPSYDLFGKVDINAYACHLEKGQGKIPFDPTNPNHRRMTAIQVYIQPLAEIDVKYPKQWECDWIGEFPTWVKITLPSIKDAGFTNVREINGLWARVARVDSADKPYEKKDAAGNGTGEFAVKKTMKFLEFYKTEEECRAAYEANGGTAAHAPEPVAQDTTDADKQTALAFLKVIAENAAKGATTLADAKAAFTTAVAAYPTVSKHFNAESPETLAFFAKAGLK